MTLAPIDLKIAEYKISRRFAFQFLYQQEINQQLFFQNHVFENFCKQSEVPNSCLSYLKNFLTEIFSQVSWIDSMIEKFSKNWKISRISKVDLSILRVAVWEISKRKEIEVAVVISDCLDIAKEYGSENSTRFINGLLDSIAHDLRKKSE